MKYIMFQTEHSAGTIQYVPVIFPVQLVHADLAKAMQRLPQLSRAKVVSAGEFEFYSLEAHGKSETLKLGTHPDDAEIIVSYGYQHGLNFDEREPE